MIQANNFGNRIIKTDIKHYILEAREISRYSYFLRYGLQKIQYLGLETDFINLCNFMKHLKYFLIRRDQVIFTNDFLGTKRGQKDLVRFDSQPKL